MHLTRVPILPALYKRVVCSYEKSYARKHVFLIIQCQTVAPLKYTVFKNVKFLRIYIYNFFYILLTVHLNITSGR